MDRTPPNSGNNDIDLYTRTYYSLLRSSHIVPIKALMEAHKRMNSSLHIYAENNSFDIAAFTYSILRLPSCLSHVTQIIMGQSAWVFTRHGHPNVESWTQVSAPGRRRRCFYDGDKILAVYIASRSDIDDIIPMLVAYQIERRKLYDSMSETGIVTYLTELASAGTTRPSGHELLHIAQSTGIPNHDLQKLASIWGDDTVDQLLHIARDKHEITIQSLAGSLADYKRATRRWWRNVESQLPNIPFDDRPIYFVSSNIHSLANLLSGHVLTHRQELRDFVDNHGSTDLQKEYADILTQAVPSNRENFLYYVWKKYEAAKPEVAQARLDQEQKVGISRIPSSHAFDIEVQVVELQKLKDNCLDPRLTMPGLDKLINSDALIINIDYPLGLAAYQVLTEIARNIADIRGVYIMGKAATLNGRVGDVMIPNVVHDEHSTNTYLFNNCFTASDVAPYLVYSAVMDNQKAITAPGTFLQNEGYMSVFYQEGYTDLEMEAGPYLSGIYEMIRPKRHPYNEIVNLYNTPFPIGVLHYASDTPFSKGHNLGTQNLSYFGMDPTYATMVAICRAILQTEITHL
ncbi:MAG TPA: hypothetical protein VLL52_16480 [Anaerolineae bacterium]|nr:hypothetical protein [Anaerolineae bacterium]